MADRYEYRVVWTRPERPDPHWNGDPETGDIPASTGRRIYQTREGARRFLARITHDFPALGIDPTDTVCCSGGFGCGCRGETWADKRERDLEQFGEIQDARIERRKVTEWETVS